MRHHASHLIRCLFLLSSLLAAFGAAQARLTTTAPHAIITDYESGEVLFAKEADTPVPPASMSKLMTLYVVFQEIEAGRLALDDELLISEEAWRRGGAASGSSTMFAEVGSEIAVSNLIRGVIIQSGNDAAIALAEGISGSEDAFADLMNARARDLGLQHSHFENATGWPDPGHEMSLADIARVARAIIREFPDFYDIYSKRSFTWNGIEQRNRNPLLGAGVGVDGLKTGHTSEAGYGVALSAQHNDERRIVVVAGMNSPSARAKEGRRLVSAAFRRFEKRVFAEAGHTVGHAPVFRGRRVRVPVATAQTLSGFVEVGTEPVTARLVYPEMPEAPVAEDTPLGELIIERPDGRILSAPVVAAESVAGLSMLETMAYGFNALIFPQTAELETATIE